MLYTLNLHTNYFPIKLGKKETCIGPMWEKKPFLWDIKCGLNRKYISLDRKTLYFKTVKIFNIFNVISIKYQQDFWRI